MFCFSVLACLLGATADAGSQLRLCGTGVVTDNHGLTGVLDGGIDTAFGFAFAVDPGVAAQPADRMALAEFHDAVGSFSVDGVELAPLLSSSVRFERHGTADRLYIEAFAAPGAEHAVNDGTVDLWLPSGFFGVRRCYGLDQLGLLESVCCQGTVSAGNVGLASVAQGRVQDLQVAPLLLDGQARRRVPRFGRLGVAQSRTRP